MKMHELLDSPEKWTQKAMARDKDGFSKFEWSEDAVCWCMAGACMRCYPSRDEACSVWRRLNRHVTSDVSPWPAYEDATAWNDDPERKYEDVVAVLKELDV